MRPTEARDDIIFPQAIHLHARGSKRPQHGMGVFAFQETGKSCGSLSQGRQQEVAIREAFGAR